ncbi:alpha/beta hydrolase [Streptomyces polyrhachis]|uniref:Alpha/beta hydrolase n=1 Tax=Streptomyces polyrhachis TaxID=1282885 RepID=A0ABW2GFJ1_9ACTN
MRRRLAGVLTALAVSAGLLAATAPTASATSAPPPLPDAASYGITVTGYTQVDPSRPASEPRLLDVTMRTAAIYRDGAEHDVRVRIRIPGGYQTNPQQPYKTLYLLHGGAGDYDDWTNDGRFEEQIKDRFNGIVVMPDAGMAGYYTDWAGNADGGFRPLWETFHIGQLLPWIDANFNTTASRSGRMIAGPSMGGFGALKYAGQHPDLFSAAASFSGGTDIKYRDAQGHSAQDTFSGHMYQAGASFLDNWGDGTTRVNLYQPGQLFPDPDQDKQREYRIRTVFGASPDTPGDPRWATVNPYDMAARYAQYGGKLALYTGGMPDDWWDRGEEEIYAYNTWFHARLQALDVPHGWCAGQGKHEWTHWQKDLVDFLNFTNGNPTCHY